MLYSVRKYFTSRYDVPFLLPYSYIYTHTYKLYISRVGRVLASGPGFNNRLNPT